MEAMKNHDPLSCLLIVAMTIGLGAEAAASSSLDIDAAPASVAASQIAEKYGVEIQLSGVTRRRVTFSIGDADGRGARFDAVNTLANALGATFTKVYVVSKAESGDAAHAKVDSTSRVLFTQTSLPAMDAVARIADSDDALAQISGEIDGAVTLSAPNLPVAQAMDEIAAQTHTSWKTVYVLTPRGARLSADQEIIGRTGAGAPIVRTAKIIYDDPARDAFLAREAQAERALADQQARAAQKQAAAQTAALTAANANSANAANAAASSGARSAYPYSGQYGANNGLVVLGGSYNSNAAPLYLGSGLIVR